MSESTGVPRDVVVVIGSGALGVAAARRIGSGRHVVLADQAGDKLEQAAATLTDAGHEISSVATDASVAASVSALAAHAADRGPIRSIVHSAGISPTQGETADILRVNLYGTALVLDAFRPLAGPGCVIVCIASQGGYRLAVSPRTEALLAHTATADLLELDVLNPFAYSTSEAYALSKRGVHVRVAAQSSAWAARGGRAISVSPGITATPQLFNELNGPNGNVVREVLIGTGSRMGTPDDIAAVIEFVTSPMASFLNGTDILADGGAIAHQRFGDPHGPGSYFFTRPPV